MPHYTNMAFNPTTGLKNGTSYETRPASEARSREILSDMPEQLKTYINNTLIPALEAEYNLLRSQGGGDTIGVDGASIGTGYSDVLQTVLEQLKTNMADITQGSVADGSITFAKLATGAVKSENVPLSATLAAVLGTYVENALDKLKLAKWYGKGAIFTRADEYGASSGTGTINGTVVYDPDACASSNGDFSYTVPTGATKLLVTIEDAAGDNNGSSGWGLTATFGVSKNGTAAGSLGSTTGSTYTYGKAVMCIDVSAGDIITGTYKVTAYAGMKNMMMRVEVVA